MSTGHELLMPFDIDDPEFVRGFECGRIWSLLRETDDEVGPESMHATNAEMAIRLAEATGRTATSTADANLEAWIEVTFSEVQRE